MNQNGFIVGVDASRLRSGGGRAHIIHLLANSRPHISGIAELQLWADDGLLAEISDRPWLVKNRPVQLKGSLINELWWQYSSLAEEAMQAGCDVMFSPNGATICRFKPQVVMSQNLLPFEPHVSAIYRRFRYRFALSINRMLQTKALRSAAGTIFLSEYAGKVIQCQMGRLANAVYIPHGVSDQFGRVRRRPWPTSAERPIRCIYVTKAVPYNNLTSVIEAIAILRAEGLNVVFDWIGDGGQSLQTVEAAIRRVNPEGSYVRAIGPVKNADLPAYLAEADIFIFASSCESMPITLLEGMAAGLPIACSNRGPMPEVAGRAAIYFNPEVPQEIANAINLIISNRSLRERLTHTASAIIPKYNWEECAKKTWDFVASVVNVTSKSANSSVP